MPESHEHMALVAKLRSHIAEHFCSGLDARILIDSAISASNARPPSLEGHVPDAYLALDTSGRVVIGEAKTMGDFDTSHSQAQIVAFLKRCGREDGSTFILAVPWPIQAFAAAHLRNLILSLGLQRVHVTVICEVDSPVNMPPQERPD